MNDVTSGQSEKLFPDFWLKAGLAFRAHLSALGLDVEDGDAIATDFISRCVGIEPVLPSDPASEAHKDFGKLMFAALLAELRLFGADDGDLVGPEHPWRDSAITELRHPFLTAVQSVVAKIEAEANEAEGTARN